jgi:hypothetical protein
VAEHPSHGTKDGLFAEASTEWGPEFLLNTSVGRSSYVRLNVSAAGYHTLFDLAASRELNSLSMYVANYVSLDWAGGSSIPIHVSQTFGGRKLRSGLGGSVRGFETKLFDTTFKAVDNLELRIHGPALLIPSLYPVGVLHLDAGYFSGYFGSPADDPQGILLSTGVTVGVNLLDVTVAGVSLTAPIVGERADGKVVEIKLRLSIHF